MDTDRSTRRTCRMGPKRWWICFCGHPTTLRVCLTTNTWAKSFAHVSWTSWSMTSLWTKHMPGLDQGLLLFTCSMLTSSVPSLYMCRTCAHTHTIIKHFPVPSISSSNMLHESWAYCTLRGTTAERAQSSWWTSDHYHYMRFWRTMPKSFDFFGQGNFGCICLIDQPTTPLLCSLMLFSSCSVSVFTPSYPPLALNLWASGVSAPKCLRKLGRPNRTWSFSKIERLETGSAEEVWNCQMFLDLTYLNLSLSLSLSVSLSLSLCMSLTIPHYTVSSLLSSWCLCHVLLTVRLHGWWWFNRRETPFERARPEGFRWVHGALERQSRPILDDW